VTAAEVFRRILGAVESAGIPYMLTGSFASSYHGAPRATQDIDLVIAPERTQLLRLASLLPAPDFYMDEATALEAYDSEGQFNVVDLATGWKADLIMRRSRIFSRTEFDRRTVVDFEGMRVPIASAEDVVLAKLEWAKLGESARQVEDVAGILRARSGELDASYMERWVRELGIEKEWAAARRASVGQPGRI
jgi:hypothetical protein